ncbi:MAG: hypothetical protein QOI35_1529 [Cryptosporangiaceae bacterium]|nr:hypothetical protein [Cryptosporangiaceae bacterium]
MNTHDTNTDAASESPVMSRLERRYRTVLRMLPRWYRDDREDEMAAVFLTERDDSVDLEYSWPGWGETAAVAALAIRTRLAGDSGPERALAWGQAVRLVALLGLAAWAAGGVASELAVAIRQLGFPQYAGLAAADQGWQVGVSTLAVVCAAGAFVALVTGRRGAAKWLAVAALGGHLAIRAASAVGGNLTSLLTADVLLLIGVPVLCLFAGYHREAPPVQHPARWLTLGAALMAGSAAIYTVQLWLVSPVAITPATWAYVLGTGAVLISPRLARVRASAGWLAALAICGALLTLTGVQQTYWAMQLSGDPAVSGAGGWAVLALAETAASAAAGLAVGIAAIRAFRRLGPVRAAA